MAEEPTSLRRRNTNKKNDDEQVDDATQQSTTGMMMHAKEEIFGKEAPTAKVQRMRKLIHQGADKLPAWAQPYVEKAEPVLAVVVTVFGYIFNFYILLFEGFEWFMQWCPPSLFRSVMGLCMCFFGGFFPVLLAAIESWNMCGGAEAQQSLTYCYQSFKTVRKESSKDDQVDDDNDGIADVNQISGRELVARKTKLVLLTVDPVTLQKAVVCVYTGWLAVVISLKVEFARTISLGVSIGEALQIPIATIVLPILTVFLPKGKDETDQARYAEWLRVTLNWAVKAVAVSIAWTIQTVISTVHSGIRGGTMAARGVFDYLQEKKWTNLNHENTQMDEIAGILLACLGIFLQAWVWGFQMPIYFSFILWPVQMIEVYLKGVISDLF